MAWNCPEQHRQSCCERGDKYSDPDGTTHEEFLDVGFADGQCSERSGLRLAEENKDGIKFVLV